MKIIFSLILVLIFSISIAYAVEYESPIIKVTLLNQDPTPARAGDTVELRLRIENTGGGTVQNLELEIQQDYPFAVIDGPALQKIGTLYAYQTGKNYINTQYRLRIDKDAVKGKHELKVKYRYDGGEWITSTFNIDVTSKEFAQIIYVDKAKIEPGKETEMKFTITNIGNAPLQNMVFSWSEANGVVLPVYSDDTKYIKYLDVGDSAELKYTVVADVNAQPGLYQLDLNLKYESLTNTTSTVIKTKAGIFVGGETDFDVAFSESSAGQTSLSVSNIGSNPAQSVSVTIPSQSAYRISGTNSAIIGNLDKGDYTLVSFQIAAANSATNATFGNTLSGQTNAGPRAAANSNLTPEQMASFRSRLNNTDSNGLKVIIDYTDTTGQRRSFNKTVQIQFRSATSLTNGVGGYGAAQTTSTSFIGSTTFYYILAGVVLLVGFYIYRKTMKNKK